MKLSQLRNHLNSTQELKFILPNGQIIPAHFHLTEAGLITKQFIDCGGTIRSEKAITIQLWTADDFDHRLSASKFISILKIAEPIFNAEDLDIEVEYQGDTIGKYSLDIDNENLLLIATQTSCLAKDKCGIPEAKSDVQLSELVASSSSCAPGGGCC
jgi:hypothetical protein